MSINKNKTKLLVVHRHDTGTEVVLQGRLLEDVDEFTYLSSNI